MGSHGSVATEGNPFYFPFFKLYCIHFPIIYFVAKIHMYIERGIMSLRINFMSQKNQIYFWGGGHTRV
jgi:hypothetical protein